MGNDLHINDLGKIGIIGPGLIGGSIALALKRFGFRGTIIGVGHREVSIELAKEIGAIDEGSLELEALAETELIIIGTPISLIRTTIDRLRNILSPGTVVTDVGSTKRKICQWGKSLMRKNIEFVGSHPVAGSEKRGVDFARHDLFVNANCFITPMKGNSRQAIELISSLWSLIGMNVIQATPSEHDKLLALVSHLPHVAAASLVNTCSQKQLEFTGSGFMDTTRISSGDVSLWSDIILSNPDHIVSSAKKFISQLENFCSAVDSQNSKEVKKFLAGAKSKRDALVQFKYNHEQIEP